MRLALVTLAVLAILASPVLGQAQRKAMKLRVDGRDVKAEPPAYLSDGRLWLPAAALLTGMGAQSQWDEDNQKLKVSLPRREVVFTLGDPTAQVNGQPVTSDLPPTMENGKLFLPARSVALALDCALALREANTVAEVTCRWEKRQVTVSEILTWPLYLSGKQLSLEGEYRGWRAPDTGDHVRRGPPKRRADWILQDPTGAIYVSGRSPKGLDPYDDVGARVCVEGCGGLTSSGIPFVEAATVTVTSPASEG